MFSLPGICGLIFFLLARPQEFYEPLQRLPFLYLFLIASISGLALDLKLRRLEPVTPPSFPWVVMFLVWIVIVDAIQVPHRFVPNMIEVGILATVYGTISIGIQRFRSLEIVAAVTMVTCLFLAFVCWDQGLQDRTCVAIDPENPGEGWPDGRPCQIGLECLDGGEPGAEYRCEKVGMFGTYSIEDRVRYRGALHDPNELSLTICVGGLCFAIAFALRRRDALWTAFAALASGLVLWTVLMTQSRGGLLVMLAVPGVYVVNKYGIRAAIAGGAVGMAALTLGGRSGAKADASTMHRYEAWAAGLGMFERNPILGVGHGSFADHHWLTAHNAFVLTLAELGLVGFFLFTTIIYMSLKTVLVGVRALATEPGAAVARTWGLALLASLLGLTFQINTLSFAYHPVLWIFIGLAGAYASSVRHHRPDLVVGFGLRDFVGLLVGCLAFVFVLLPLFLRWKQAM